MMKKKELERLEERIKELEETAAKLEIKNKILLDHLREEQQTTKALLEEMNELIADYDPVYIGDGEGNLLRIEIIKE